MNTNQTTLSSNFVPLALMVGIVIGAVSFAFLSRSDQTTVHENQIVRAVTYCQGTPVGQDAAIQNSIDYLVFKGQEVLVVCENGAFTTLKTFMGNPNAK